jgi:DNA-binding NtrC family response regulator
MQRVLVLDRNPYVRSFLCRVLAQRRLAVQEAKNGAELLSALDSDICPHVVVYDPEAPGAQGRGLLRTIRVKRPDLQVILHAYLCDDTELEASQLTAACVEKSADPTPLLTAVDRLLNRDKGRAGAL